MTNVTINFDASLGENTSGACFKIIARDYNHAQQIAEWLKSKCNDVPHIVASISADPVIIPL